MTLDVCNRKTDSVANILHLDLCPRRVTHPTNTVRNKKNVKNSVWLFKEVWKVASGSFKGLVPTSAVFLRKVN